VQLIWFLAFAKVPNEHSMHDRSEVADPFRQERIIVPLWQVVQFWQVAWRGRALNVPASQSVQAATLEAEEYFPAGHAVHVVAPVAAPVSVMDPAAQSVQAATLEAEEYFPLAHGVHDAAPVAAPVSVMDPGAQD